MGRRERVSDDSGQEERWRWRGGGGGGRMLFRASCPPTLLVAWLCVSEAPCSACRERVLAPLEAGEPGEAVEVVEARGMTV